MAGIRARLADARLRRRLDILLEGLAWSAAIGLGVLCATYLVTRLGTGLDRTYPWRAPMLFGSVAFGIAALAAAVRAIAFPPSDTVLARRADRLFLLDERVSTALEIEPSRAVGWAATLRAATLTEAGSRAAAIDTRQLAPFRAPTVLWAVAVLGLIVGGLTLVPLPSLLDAPSRAVTIEPTQQQREETSTNLHQIAQEIREETAPRDGYRDAIARTLDDAANQYAAGAVTHGELAEQLNQLLDHARRLDSPGGAAPSGSVDIPQMIEDALQAHLDQRQPDAEALAEEPLPDAGNGEQPPAEPGDVTTPGTNTGEVRAMDPSIPRPAFMNDGVDIYATMDYEDGDYEPARDSRQSSASAEQFAATPVGGASNAGKGEGDAAGQGVVPLGGEALLGQDAFALLEAMALPIESGESGRRIRIEVDPTATASTPAAAPAAGAWQATPAEVIDRHPLGPEDRAIVARYFAHDETAP